MWTERQALKAELARREHATRIIGSFEEGFEVVDQADRVPEPYARSNRYADI
jgi:hypothetical protein